MPMTITTVAGAAGYASPFVGPVNHTAHIKVDLSGLTVDEVDAYGYLKPGVPFLGTGLLVTAGAVWGATVEAVMLPLVTIPPTNTTLGTETADCFVAVATHGIYNRDIGEDNLGRALTAAEIAGFALASCNIRLLRT